MLLFERPRSGDVCAIGGEFGVGPFRRAGVPQSARALIQEALGIRVTLRPHLQMTK